MRKSKLFVGGCSFSDRFGKINTCWGEELANMKNMDYCHDAVRTSGSNDRIWRVLTDKIMSGEIEPEDKVIVQYTLPSRREFVTWKNPQSDVYKDIFPGNEEDLYIVKFKDKSHEWHKDIDVKEFLKLYEVFFSMDEYEKRIFNHRQYQFQMLCEIHNINAFILSVNTYTFWDVMGFTTSQKFKNERRIFKDNKFGYEEDERYSEDDPHHLSVKGHIKFANLINKWIGPR